VSPHRPQLSAGLMLGTRQAAAVLLHRHPDLIRRACVPVACDLASHALLYDLDAAALVFASVQRRRVA
jgi:hypothetical protein